MHKKPIFNQHRGPLVCGEGGEILVERDRELVEILGKWRALTGTNISLYRVSRDLLDSLALEGHLAFL